MNSINPYNQYEDYWFILSSKISGFKEHQEKLESDEQYRRVFMGFWNWYEVLGVFVKAGYLDIHVVALMWCGLTKTFYGNLVMPMIDELQEFYSMPRAGSEGLYVYNELLDYLKKHPELDT